LSGPSSASPKRRLRQKKRIVSYAVSVEPMALSGFQIAQ
jgi:hypothetical protein